MEQSYSDDSKRPENEEFIKEISMKAGRKRIDQN
jgi:hypothetical protein